jgi:hypothetical protein
MTPTDDLVAPSITPAAPSMINARIERKDMVICGVLDVVCTPDLGPIVQSHRGVA